MRACVGSLLALALLASCDKQESDSKSSLASMNVTQPTVDPNDARTPAPADFKLPNGTLDNKALGNWAKLKRDFAGGDAFTKGFADGALANRNFIISIPIAEGSQKSAANWSYDKEKEELLLELDMDYGAHVDGQMATFQKAVAYGTPRPMSNAFGVSVNVTPVTNWLIGLGTNTGYAGIIPKDALASDGDKIAYDYLKTKIKMPGDEARLTVSGMTLIMEGKVVKDKAGNTVECGEEVEQPKIDNPYETTNSTCIIQARFTRIAFVAKNGRVVKEWLAR